MTTTYDRTAAADTPTVGARDPGPRRGGRLHRIWRGRPQDPGWIRPALLGLLVATAALYLWDLSASGWANAYYSAAVQAATQNWSAFLFGSSDAAGFITVDKPPASLWVMALSARAFGVGSWSILLPQALMGVASVSVLVVTVRRWAGPVAGLVAGAALALTPVAALMFRYNNPDALLVLLLVLAAYAVVRAVDAGSLRWIAATGALVGLAFLTKSLQAFLVLPALAAVWLVAARTSRARRLVGLAVGAATLLVAGGWWVALVELWPAGSRPYVGGSQTNSVLELVWGYNGLGRITGNETGSVVPGDGSPAAGMWGETGLTRLFDAQYGGQASWLLPAALLLLVALVAVSVRAPRTDRVRAAALLWGGWLLVTGLVISLSQGIIHPYYTVAMAPAIGALVGTGAVTLWQRRGSWSARVALSATLLATAGWAFVLLGRTGDWLPWLRWVVAAGAVVAAVLLLLCDRLPRRVALATAGASIVLALLAPLAYSVQTAVTPQTGSLPSAGPAVTGAFAGPGGGPGGPGGPGGAPGGVGGAVPMGPPPGVPGGALPGGALPGGGATGGATAPAPGGAGAPPAAAGGLLDAGTTGTALTALLSADADRYTWVAAAVGAQSAAGLQLATGDPVMSLGGFNGSDPYPTLAAFQQYVADGAVHWFVAGGSGGPGGMSGTSGSTTAQITSWVTSTFTARTVDGVTVYDLTAPASENG